MKYIPKSNWVGFYPLHTLNDQYVIAIQKHPYIPQPKTPHPLLRSIIAKKKHFVTNQGSKRIIIPKSIVRFVPFPWGLNKPTKNVNHFQQDIPPIATGQGTMYTGPKAKASERRRYALSSLGFLTTTCFVDTVDPPVKVFWTVQMFTWRNS